MALFQINLAKGRVMPPASRAAWTWFLVAYLGLCGAVLAGLMNQVTRELIAIHEQRDELFRLEARVLKTCVPEGTDDIVAYARQKSREMARSVDTLESIERILGRRPAVDEMLLGLAAPLPPSTCLGSLSLDGQKREIDFDVYVASERDGDGLVPPHLIALWALQTNLMSQVVAIESVHSQQAKLGGQVFNAWKFRCRIAEGAQ